MQASYQSPNGFGRMVPDRRKQLDLISKLGETGSVISWFRHLLLR